MQIARKADNMARTFDEPRETGERRHVMENSIRIKKIVEGLVSSTRRESLREK